MQLARWLQLSRPTKGKAATSSKSTRVLADREDSSHADSCAMQQPFADSQEAACAELGLLCFKYIIPPWAT